LPAGRRSSFTSLALVFFCIWGAAERGEKLTESEAYGIDVPVIDVSALVKHTPDAWASNAEVQSVIEAINRACRIWGFFQITNHGLDSTQFEKMMRRFFDLPLSEKLFVKRTHNNSRGYANDEYTKQVIDVKEIFDFGHIPRKDLPNSHPDNVVLDGFNQWPQAPLFQLTMMAYYDKCADLSRLIMSAIAAGLGLHIDHFDRSFIPHTSFLRLNYYPVPGDISNSKARDSTLGISRHTDAGALTLLLQDQSVNSLQVYSGTKEDHQDGRWVFVKPAENAFTVNIGDMLQVWSGGLFSAPEHRVLASTDTARYSAPFFYNPSYDTLVEPVPHLVGEATRINAEATLISGSRMYQRVKPYTGSVQWGEFRSRRFQGDYANVGTESQIEDWKVSKEGPEEEL
jgi:isopenicillin N synthase-like dioxygenase